MPSVIHRLSVVLRILVVASVCVIVIFPQTPRPFFKKVLVEHAKFDEVELAALENDEIVVKLITGDNKDKKEVRVFGAMRISIRPDISLSEFQKSLEQKTNEAVLSQGSFSLPPGTDDLRGYKLDKQDLKDLRNCEVGDCDLKMSRDMLKKLRAGIDSNANDSDTVADQLFRQIIVDYVQDYIIRGDKALLQYDGRQDSVRLSDEFRLLFEHSPIVNSLAPEFRAYLTGFPRNDLSGVSNNFTWSQVSFGLKPMLTVTHSAAYEQHKTDLPQYLIATKQIYASRYMNASLAFAMLIRVANENAVFTYLIFSDVSRSDDLGGAFSGLKHSLVDGEATKRVKVLLQRTKAALELSSREPNTSKTPPSGENILTQVMELSRNRYLQAALVLLFFLGAYVLYRRWRARRTSARRDPDRDL